MLKKRKTESLKSLDNKLWKIFSKFIRLRDSKNGLCQCITCGRFFPIPEMDAGHFQSRRYKSTKFNEQNVNAQCRYCNRFNSGEQYAHSVKIDEKWGKGTAEKLYNLSRIQTKLSRRWYLSAIDEYKEKLKWLEKTSVNVTSCMSGDFL